MDLKELDHAGEHAVFGSIEVLGNFESSNTKLIRRDVDLLQNTQTKLNTKIDNYWGDLSADGIITPVEKVSLKKEWSGIQQTYSALYQEASSKQILNTPYWLDYDEAYDNLKKMLLTDEALFDLMESTSTLKDKQAFDAAFEEYYYSQQFVNLAITTGLIDKLGLRSLTSLEEEGTNGELAFYRGELYQYDQDQWVKIGTQAYLGIINTYGDFSETKQNGQYFLTGAAMQIKNQLQVNGKGLIVNTKKLFVKYMADVPAGVILYWQDGRWYVADDDDPRYVAILADYITVTGEMPDLFNNLVEDFVETIIPPEPRYLGPSSIAPVNPNKDDYFLYSGINVGDWVKGRIYRWDGSLWIKLEYDDYGTSEYYMTALQDILQIENAGDGYFSSLFCNAFFANQASINALKVKTIYLYNTGALQSQNDTYVSETTGLRIDASGNIDANGWMHIKGPCAIGHSLSGIGNYNLYIDGNTYIGGNANFNGYINAKSFQTPNYDENNRTGIRIGPEEVLSRYYTLTAQALRTTYIAGWGKYYIDTNCINALCLATSSQTKNSYSELRNFIGNYGLDGINIWCNGSLVADGVLYTLTRIRLARKEVIGGSTDSLFILTPGDWVMRDINVSKITDMKVIL